MSAGVEFVKDGHVAQVTLDNPKALNAITPPMDDALFAAWTEINDDPDIWVAVLSATGERAFCAGADISGGTEGPERRMALGGGLTGVGWPLDVALATRYETIEAYAGRKDRHEGRAAFAEKRKPQWQGR